MATLQEQIELAKAKAEGLETAPPTQADKEEAITAANIPSMDAVADEVEEYSPKAGDFKLTRLRRIVTPNGKAHYVNAHGYIEQPKDDVLELLEHLASTGDATLVE